MVRGLDYYNSIIYEWTTDLLGSQTAICAGGRYDGLIKHISNKSGFGAGVAAGIDRIIEL